MLSFDDFDNSFVWAQIENLTTVQLRVEIESRDESTFERIGALNRKQNREKSENMRKKSKV
jgi:hypothetical protein